MIRLSRSWTSLINYKQKRRLSNITKQMLRPISAYDEIRVEEYPKPASTIINVDYEEIRETVQSIWRKRHPSEQIKIIAFLIPKNETQPSDYHVLADSNYRSLLESIDPTECTVILYELEGGYFAPPNTPVTPSVEQSDAKSAMFNEFIVCNSEDSDEEAHAVLESGWNLRLNFILFV